MQEETEYTTVIKRDGTIHAKDVDGLFRELHRLQEWRERPSLSELPEVIDIPDAAKIIGVNRDTLYEWLREPECDIPFRRVGIRRKVIPKRALIQWLESA